MDVTTLTNWEVGRTAPALVHLPGVFDFLGYVPYDPSRPFPRLLRTRREALGLTQEELAKKLRIDPTTVARWERGDVRPSAVLQARLDALLRA